MKSAKIRGAYAILLLTSGEIDEFDSGVSAVFSTDEVIRDPPR
jgi:hypothetical protein